MGADVFAGDNLGLSVPVEIGEVQAVALRPALVYPDAFPARLAGGRRLGLTHPAEAIVMGIALDEAVTPIAIKVAYELAPGVCFP